MGFQRDAFQSDAFQTGLLEPRPCFQADAFQHDAFQVGIVADLGFAITAQPQNVSITIGSSTVLSVSAIGGVLTYQWYIGSSGDTSSPIGGATSTTVLVSPVVTTNYWVQVTNDGVDTLDSNTATVTVTTVSIPMGGSGYPAPHGLMWKRKSLSQRVSEWVDDAVKDLYGELVKTEQKQAAAEIVRPFAKSDAPIPSQKAVDWTALRRDTARAQLLLDLLYQLRAQEMLLADDDDFFMMM